MSNCNVPVQVTSDDEEPKTPTTVSPAHSSTRTPILVASPTPTPPASFPIPMAQPQPRPPSPSQPGPSRWRQHLHAKGVAHKRTARMRVKPPPLHLAELEQFAWVRDTLDKWRTEEGLKRIMEANGTSPLSPNMPITREPIERTIPPLVVRTDRHDRTLQEWQERHRQLEGHMRGWVETKACKRRDHIAQEQTRHGHRASSDGYGGDRKCASTGGLGRAKRHHHCHGGVH